jgi:hypothetical protein
MSKCMVFMKMEGNAFAGVLNYKVVFMQSKAYIHVHTLQKSR